ncbi:pseudouridine synthase [Mycoplasmopsis synoviae]|uniref:Pseudouridine synthase n=2 Tax=Mycoplasmopsis synoviae TaxID=2109 RepID=Q4A5Z2_MYCS5|nr:pseudouridine synthase [Mycoplasmopsis synoviae]AAZ43829.2 16S rRNA uridine-516 pseudouridylate synthase and related Pseudouridylate synthase [Mycoplasmopsis synoviae 53]
MKIRIEKFIADSTLYTRNEIKKLISKGLVKVNDLIIKKSQSIDPKLDKIYLEGILLEAREEFSYIMMNKPAGYICANFDWNKQVVFELLLDLEMNLKDFFTIGRLDIDTEGLLIITNDGKLSHNLLSPKKHIPKTYYVELDKPLEKNIKELLEKELLIDEIKYKKSILNNISNNKWEITIFEGKFHQIKIIFAHFGYKVTYLKRIKMNNLSLDENLKPGEYKFLTKEELDLLKN